MNSSDGRAVGLRGLRAVAWGLAVLGTGAPWTSLAADAGPRVEIRRQGGVELTWPSKAGMVYQVEASSAVPAKAWTALATNLPGTDGKRIFTEASPQAGQRFYRILEAPAAPAGGVISAQAVLPQPGIVYPERTIFGNDILGLQYTIPGKWKGGLREGSSMCLFGSDTEAGLIVSLFTFAGDGNRIASQLNAPFETSDTGGYQLSVPMTATGNRVSGEWIGWGAEQGVILRLEGVVHPSGGLVGFFGFFLSAGRAGMQSTLDQFVGSVVTAPRKSDTSWVQTLTGRAFQWVSYKSTGSGGTSGSLSRWSENNVFFCSGTYEVTRFSESSYSGTLSGGAVYGGASSSNSTEAGDWTVLQTANGPLLVMMSSSGINSAIISLAPGGNSFYFGDQEFSLRGASNCAVP